MSETVTIVYVLNEYEKIGYLPSAFVVPRNSQGDLMAATNRVYWHTLEDYGLEQIPEREQIFTIIDLLQIPKLEEKYNRGKKKALPLEKLLADADAKKLIQQHVHQQISHFISLLRKHKYILATNIDRKDYIDKGRLHFAEEKLEPNLHFQKREDGIHYQLSFNSSEKQLVVSEQEVKILTNNPAWIVFGDQVHSLEAINGNMLKPFLAKNEIKIPSSYVKEYFQKFILRVVSKAKVEADGFQIIKHDQLSHCEISVTQNFINNNSGITLHFIYEHVRFGYMEKTRQKTYLKFDEQGEIIVYQYKRDLASEKTFSDSLESFDLESKFSNFFQLKNTEAPDNFFYIEWLTRNRKMLQQAGFKVMAPTIQEKPIALYEAQVNLNLNKEKDWFDINGEIQVGQFSFPFRSLVNHIRSKDRFFPLPDGQYFIIPNEWMNQYESVSQFGKVENDSIRLTKSQFPVLENIEFSAQGDQTESLNADYESIDYQTPKSLKADLRPYQLNGVKWLINLYKHDLGGCLADDMGLGKTLQTLAVLLYAKEQRELHDGESNQDASQLTIFQQNEEKSTPLNALIILPASLIFNWKNEIYKFAPQLSVYGHIGTKRYKNKSYLLAYDVILTTYHTALRDIELLEQIEFEYIVLDESQQIKNKDSKIFQAVNQLQGKHKLSLSGTPIENSLSDLWAQMQFINPSLLGSFPFFKKEFIRPIEKGASDQKKDQLRSLIAPYMLRRTKEMVAKDLPELSLKVFYSDMTKQQKKMYEQEKSAARNYIIEHFLEGNSKFNIVVLKALLRLRQISNHPKLFDKEYAKDSGKFNDIMNHLEVIRKGGHKVLIFSQFVSHLSLFEEKFKQNGWNYSLLTGKTPVDKRGEVIQRFEQEESVSLFLISMKAGNSGLNLTAADYVIIADPWWNPSVEQQAIARAHRIGQTKNVIALKFITKDSIEEKILQLQIRKMKLVEDIIENNNRIKFNKDEILSLLD